MKLKHIIAIIIFFGILVLSVEDLSDQDIEFLDYHSGDSLIQYPEPY